TFTHPRLHSNEKSSVARRNVPGLVGPTRAVHRPPRGRATAALVRRPTPVPGTCSHQGPSRLLAVRALAPPFRRPGRSPGAERRHTTSVTARHLKSRPFSCFVARRLSPGARSTYRRH